MDDIDNVPLSREEFTTLQTQLLEIMLVLGGIRPPPIAPTAIDPPPPRPFITDPIQANTSVGLLPIALPHATGEVRQPAHLTLFADEINH